jgi:hypothetical protein
MSLFYLHVQGTDDSITKARKILSSMGRRMVQNKIIMAGVALFLLLGIILVSIFLKRCAVQQEVPISITFGWHVSN